MVLLAIITTYYWFSIICLDCGLWTIFRFTRALKFDVGLLINEQLFKIFFRNAILKMWYDYEIILLKKGLNILRKIWKSIYTGLHYFYYIVELFCISLISLWLLLLRKAMWSMGLLFSFHLKILNSFIALLVFLQLLFIDYSCSHNVISKEIVISCMSFVLTVWLEI